MLARSIALVLTAVTAATAWPIFFYESNNCNHYPVLTLEDAPPPNQCHTFGHVDIKSFSGGTKDSIQKVLLYDTLFVCEHDAAHHAYSNYTIGNDTNLCVPLSGPPPRAYVFIEEFLGPIPGHANASSCDNALRIQN